MQNRPNIRSDSIECDRLNISLDKLINKATKIAYIFDLLKRIKYVKNIYKLKNIFANL